MRLSSLSSRVRPSCASRCDSTADPPRLRRDVRRVARSDLAGQRYPEHGLVQEHNLA